MEEYRTGPAIIDETVRVAKKYLEEHPEENSYQRGDSKTRVLHGVTPESSELIINAYDNANKIFLHIYQTLYSFVM